MIVIKSNKVKSPNSIKTKRATISRVSNTLGDKDTPMFEEKEIKGHQNQWP